MRLILVILFLAGCSQVKLEGNCYVPFLYGGEIIKVLNCTDNYSFDSEYCIIERKRVRVIGGGFVSKDTDSIFKKYLEDSIQVSCEKYDSVVAK